MNHMPKTTKDWVQMSAFLGLLVMLATGFSKAIDIYKTPESLDKTNEKLEMTNKRLDDLGINCLTNFQMINFKLDHLNSSETKQNQMKGKTYVAETTN